MRRNPPILISSAAALVAAVLGLSPAMAQPAPAKPQQPAKATQPAPPPGPGPQAPQPAPPRPYKAIAVTPATPLADPSFEAFRKQLGEIVGRKDRTALAGLLAQNFFWMASQGEKADRKKKPIDNFATAVDLDAGDGSGWEVLAAAAGEATLQPLPQRKGVLCAPAPPAFDAKAFDQLLKASRTDVLEWAYATKPSLEVRAGAAADAPVAETLGAILVRVMPEPPPPGAPQGGPPSGGPPPSASPPGQAATTPVPPAPPTVLRIVTPAGKTGWIAADSVQPLVFEQICYAKDAGGWKIAGYLGGE
ncbi:MAG: hypothetical protein HXX10_22175 [Rhodoplanes sp.]|uniref:hypothetical protein n=1 Tax=Rhodoplanes sp. TaxID=1968906 RepID=UPI001791F04A|nr:hypothetical protein [Rhodoplanes sp.]NVO16740.1 hypothetical protein [Rhodoplanes sp.]